ncbi:polycomb group RING finger protein 1-like isoform X2 [Clavelina lepadiformis]|uniref:polycomb group RING finger protein 1-like isoform X2 n=1 Tax=Clavelina lepadiformis TaxID=159417 RepID=UPI004041403E
MVTQRLCSTKLSTNLKMIAPDIAAVLDEAFQQEKDLILRIRDINEHIVCALCAGYFIDATTISECSHTFCKSCIVKHLQTKKSCPECGQKIHETQPLLSLRSDRVMQDVVYKVVPNLFQGEQQREAEFYRSRGIDFALSGSHLLNIGTPLKYTQQKVIRESISGQEVYDRDVHKIPNLNTAHRYEYDEKICLQFSLHETMKDKLDESGEVQLENFHFFPIKEKFVRCPTRATVWHLKKIVSHLINFSVNDCRYEVCLSYCGHDLHESTCVKKLLMLHWYKNTNHEKRYIPMIEYQLLERP